MLKYTHAPGAVVSRLGSSETGSVGRTIVSVPPRFWASAEGTSAATRPSTSSPINSREGQERMRLSPVFEGEQIVGGRHRGIERVHDAVELAHEGHARELERVAVGVERGQLAC